MYAPHPRSESILDRSDLHRILDFLGDCEGLPDLAEFRHGVTEAMARRLGHRHTTFFASAVFEDLRADQQPVARGKAAAMMPSYVEHYHRFEPFVDMIRGVPPADLRPMSLDRMARPLRYSHRHYVDDFLFANGIHSMLVIPLVPADGDPHGSGAIGWLEEESGAFGPRDLAIANLLRQHLTGLFRHHATEAAEWDLASGLSPRQRQIAELVAEGKTNQEIARALCIGVDTVKKHLTRALKVTGCTNRTQLAIRYRPSPAPGRPR